MGYSSGGQLVATLITPPGQKITPELLNALTRMSETAGARSVSTEWLAENEVVDLFGTSLGQDGWCKALKQMLDKEPIDIIVQPAANRRKKFLAADMESTIIEQEMLDELAIDIGAGELVAGITRRAMNGELDFKSALRERMALFGGKPVSLLENAAKRMTIMPGGETLVATMKANGAAAWLITGGFTYFGKLIEKKLGFDQSHGNELILKDDVIVGEVAEPLLDRMRKRQILETALKTLNLTPADAVAVGDGANDLPMLGACNENNGLGIAFHAKPKVRESIAHQVNHCDLTALLYAQGYKKEEFVRA